MYILRGEMLNDRICGYGKMIYFNGDEYTGEWVNELVSLGFNCLAWKLSKVYLDIFPARRKQFSTERYCQLS